MPREYAYECVRIYILYVHRCGDQREEWNMWGAGAGDARTESGDGKRQCGVMRGCREDGVVVVVVDSAWRYAWARKEDYPMWRKEEDSVGLGS